MSQQSRSELGGKSPDLKIFDFLNVDPYHRIEGKIDRKPWFSPSIAGS
jgi:hypothetical protein